MCLDGRFLRMTTATEPDAARVKGAWHLAVGVTVQVEGRPNALDDGGGAATPICDAVRRSLRRPHPKHNTLPSCVPTTTRPEATAGEAEIGEPAWYCQSSLPDSRSRR
jgi:hypothetical protein